MRDERMKELPNWLHKKNFNVIETQGTVTVTNGVYKCPCGNGALSPDGERCPTCKEEGTVRENECYLSQKEEMERRRYG